VSEIIRFEPNVPVEVALKFADGRDVEGQYGPQKMFSCTDGRVFYVNSAVAEKITAAGIQPRQPLRICKRQSGRTTEWQIEPVAAPKPAPTAAAAIALPPQLAAPPDANLMAACLMQAVDSCIQTEKYAAAKGYGIQFTSEDVRAIAASLYIQHSKSGGSSWKQ